MNFDVQLAGWRESHNGGFVASFWFADADDAREKLALITERKGKMAGQLFTMTLESAEEPIAIASEQATNAPKEKKAPTHHQDKPIARWLSVEAGKDPMFWQFLNCHSEQETATMVRALLDVESRGAIDGDARLEKKFHAEIREPYQAWLKKMLA